MEAQAIFPDRVRLPISFDPNLLRRDLENLSGAEWIDHFVQQNYEGSWSAIPLRGPAGAKHPVMMIYPDPTASSFEDTPMLSSAPYIQHVLATFACPVQAVRLMRLTPGSVIREHRDHDLSFEEGTVRIHVPVTTSPAATFVLNGRRVEMGAGSAWYLRLSDPHSAANHGTVDRVHLVIDALVNSWLQNILEKSEAD